MNSFVSMVSSPTSVETFSRKFVQSVHGARLMDIVDTGKHFIIEITSARVEQTSVKLKLNTARKRTSATRNQCF